MIGGQQHRHRAQHMDGRANVGIGIELIELRHEPREQIIAFKRGGAQILAGGPDQINGDRDRIGDNDKAHHIPKRIDIIQKRIEDHADHIHKPEQIGDHEPFAERDQIIQPAIHRRIMIHGVEPFYKHEQQTVHRPVQQQQKMLEFIAGEVVQPKLSIINRRLPAILPFLLRHLCTP